MKIILSIFLYFFIGTTLWIINEMIPYNKDEMFIGRALFFDKDDWYTFGGEFQKESYEFARGLYILIYPAFVFFDFGCFLIFYFPKYIFKVMAFIPALIIGIIQAIIISVKSKDE